MAGDDLLFGPGKIHDLEDALRLWLDRHPDDLAEIATVRPDGPLALSHRTGERRDRPGTERRFDAVWVSKDFSVEGVAFPYEESRAVGSDHSARTVDFDVK